MQSYLTKAFEIRNKLNYNGNVYFEVQCPGFGWVNLLHSGWYGDMFWICAEHRG